MSLIFLLYGDNPLNAKIGLQKLLILYQSQDYQTTNIQEWILKKNVTNWRLTIIEALWTIKAKYVLQKLGLDTTELHDRFLNPSNAEINLHIHPVLKGLYCMCEQLVPSQARQLIDYVNSMDGRRYQINFMDEKYLEVFLLHWLSELVIEAGEWSVVQSKKNVFCKLDAILEFFNSNRPQLAELADQLNRIRIRFNYTSHNVTSIERKANVTDDDGNDDQGKDTISKDCKKTVDSSSQNGSHKYRVERDTAGFVLIINQIKFKRDRVRRVSETKYLF